MPARFAAIATCLFLAMATLRPPAAHGQGEVDLEGRPVAEVRVEGLEDVPERLVRNQIRMLPGRPYDDRTVSQDIVRINHLGRFSFVQARVDQNDDGSLTLTYVVREWPLLEDVQVVGNEAVSDQEIKELVLFAPGDPADPFLIDRGIRLIEAEYRDRGFFVADVTIDEQALTEQDILIFRVREGPKVKIRRIQFEGAASIPVQELQQQIESETALLLFRQGTLSRTQLELDAAAIREFYRDRGYLDAQVGRRIDLSPDQRDAVVTFLIEEGDRYLVDAVRVEGNTKFPADQIKQHLELGRGDVYSTSGQERSARRVRTLYGGLGYLDVQVDIERLFHDDQPLVDLLVRIEEEGEPAVVGKVEVRGNALTQTKVVLHQVRGMTPGRRFDAQGVEETRQRLNASPFFSEAEVTILGERGDPVRDVLIEVQEQNTGSISFGAGVSSDAGIGGSIDLSQRNFDITDLPESFGEFFSGRAFRGAGQSFRLSLQPGNEFSQYLLSMGDPTLFNSDFSISGRGFFRTREFTEFDEQRFGGSLGVGRAFGDRWTGAIRGRVESVSIESIEFDAPVDLFDVEGENLLTAVGVSLSRDTIDSRIRPTSGSIVSLGVDRAGLIGGDFDFTRFSAEFRKFWTLRRDFLDRPSVFSIRLETGYIPEGNEAPFFERFFAGGRNFRGFDFRGVGPAGINRQGEESDEPVGEEWLVLMGLQYEFPIFGEELRGVVFTDQGTLDDEVGLDAWRVSIGAGVRLSVPIISPVPFALDFAVPLIEEDSDDTRIFSFDIDLPLR